jgi:hypothetical protein
MGANVHAIASALRRAIPRLAGLSACVVALVVACSPAATGSPSSERPSSGAAVGPSGQPASPPPMAATPVASSALPTPAPVASIPVGELTEQEQELVSELREDVRVDCRPRRTDLPDGALLGVECFPTDDLVARVGIYGFASTRDAALAYLDRMSRAGVAPNSGRCLEGIPGEGAWTAGDGEGSVDDVDAIVVRGQTLVSHRSGCFHDENGTANYRATCWAPVYVGVLGATRDLAALEDWAWRYPDDVEPSTPGPPGICPYEPGLPDMGPLEEGDTP